MKFSIMSDCKMFFKTSQLVILNRRWILCTSYTKSQKYNYWLHYSQRGKSTVEVGKAPKHIFRKMTCFRCPPAGSIIYNANDNIPESHVSVQVGLANWQWKLNIHLCFLPVPAAVVPMKWHLQKNFLAGLTINQFMFRIVSIHHIQGFYLALCAQDIWVRFLWPLCPGQPVSFGEMVKKEQKKTPTFCGVKLLLHFSELLLLWRHSCLLLQNVCHIFRLVTETIQNQKDVQ